MPRKNIKNQRGFPPGHPVQQEPWFIADALAALMMGLCAHAYCP
jgi:hypothetical protein